VKERHRAGDVETRTFPAEILPRLPHRFDHADSIVPAHMPDTQHCFEKDHEGDAVSPTRLAETPLAMRSPFASEATRQRNPCTDHKITYTRGLVDRDYAGQSQRWSRNSNLRTIHAALCGSRAMSLASTAAPCARTCVLSRC